MTTEDLRTQAIADHQAEVDGWVEAKKVSVRQSLNDKIAATEADLETLKSDRAALDPEVPAEEPVA